MVTRKTTNKVVLKEDKAEENAKARPVSLNIHEIVIGDMVVEETSGTEEFRNKMADDATPLDAARTYDPAAAAGTAAGAGALCGMGAIARIISYRRNF